MFIIQPSDRLKTDEELAKEEAERLAELEEDRMRRMKGVALPDLPDAAAVQGILTHRSADDLDDG